jgi:murein DD-endopeptidase MepM/ murein hydrolase activator NlpD
MNIILIGGPRTGTRSINLKCSRTRWICASAALLMLSAVVSAGFFAGRGLGTVEGLSASDVEQLRQHLLTQQAQLDETEARAKRDLDALAMQLGELQAQATRLNALGTRLTRMGKLEDGEFDFAQAPSVGGPETPAQIDADYFAPTFSDSIERLRNQFSAQAEQLGVLETLLLDRDLEAEFMPSGMPVRSGFMASNFGNRIDPFNGSRAFHAGVDFDGNKGADILTVASGVVIFAGRHPAYGNMIDIDHGNGYVTRYAHNDKNLVNVGDVVTGGQLIGKMGATGRATGSHLHFEVWYEGKPVNPKKYVSAIR